MFWDCSSRAGALTPTTPPHPRPIIEECIQKKWEKGGTGKGHRVKLVRNAHPCELPVPGRALSQSTAQRSWRCRLGAEQGLSEPTRAGQPQGCGGFRRLPGSHPGLKPANCV